MPKSIQALREQYGLSRKAFTEKFNIPYRTLQSWELGERNCPEYVLSLIEDNLEANETMRSMYHSLCDDCIGHLEQYGVCSECDDCTWHELAERKGWNKQKEQG